MADTLAKLMEESKTQAVTKSLRDRFTRVRRQRAGKRLAEELDEIALHCASLPVLDNQRGKEIQGYNEHGLHT